VLSFSAKIYPKALGLAATLDPSVIFKILIMILNLYDSSLSESDCNTRPKSLGYGFACKVVL
jgi:hypothetical protein